MLKVGSYSNTGAPFLDWGNHQTSPSNNSSCRGLASFGANHSPLLSTVASMSGSLGNHDVRNSALLTILFLSN